MSDQAFWAILALTFVTFFNRSFGYWLMRFIPLTGRTRAGLEALPPAILISLVAPMAIAAGAIGYVCIGITTGVFLITKDPAIAVGVAILSVIGIRYLGA